MLPRVMEQSQYESAMELKLLVVHIRTVSLSSKFDGRDMKIRVKHGDLGVSSVCDTAAVRFYREPAFRSRLPSLPAVVDFDTSCVFLWQGIQSSPLRLRLVSGSGRGRADGAATVLLHGDARGLQEFDLQLSRASVWGPSAEPQSVEILGRVGLATEICRMSKGDLQGHLARLQAQKRQGAFVLAEMPVAVGKVQGFSAEVDDDEVLPGLPVCH